MKSSHARGLGKGLGALLSEEYSASAQPRSQTPPAQADTALHAPVRVGGLRTEDLPLSAITSGKFQPRTRFTDEQLNELAASIAKNGVMQPIVVRPHPEKSGMYEIIAGERRWRASQKAGMQQIPAIIREMEDQQALELALVENIQRQDLTPIEEALGYQRLMDEFAYSQDELSSTVGKSRSHVANLIRLLALPEEIKEMLNEGELTMGHARAVLKAEKPVEMAQEIVRRGLNVRQAENLMRGGLPAKPQKLREGAALPAPANENAAQEQAAETTTVTTATTTVTTPAQAAAPNPAAAIPEGYYQRPKDPDILALEETLTESLGLKVEIQDQGGRGMIQLSYESLEQLDSLLNRMGGM